MTEPRSIEDQLGTLERRVTSMDKRLERVEGKQDAMQVNITNILSFQQANSERIALMDERFTQRFDGLEKRFDGLEKRFDGLEKRFDGLEKRFGGLEKRFDDLTQRFDDFTRRFDGLEKLIRESRNGDAS